MLTTEEQPNIGNITLPDFSNIELGKLQSKTGKSENGAVFISTNPRGREFPGLIVFNTGSFWLWIDSGLIIWICRMLSKSCQPYVPYSFQ